MEAVLSVLGLVILTAVWTVFLYRKTRGKIWSPLWMSFSLVVLGVYLFGAGVLGYELSANTHVATESTVWWQVWTGLLSAGAAIVLGWIGVRSNKY
jgi:cell shape-determining protein MreD